MRNPVFSDELGFEQAFAASDSRATRAALLPLGRNSSNPLNFC